MNAILRLDTALPEAQWRCAPETQLDPSAFVVSRWTHSSDEPVTVKSDGHPTHHCIALALRSTTARLICGGLPIVDGRLPAGTVQVTPPGVSATAEFSAASDVIHLFVPPQIMAQCYADASGEDANDPVILDNLRTSTDPTLERLGQALNAAHSQDPQLSQLFANSLAIAIVSRVVANHARESSNRGSQLAQWRLRRALAFIDSNLGAPIGLADIASSTGLTRMHFAAQFRRSTGMRPHDYLTRRRIERAQDLLRRDGDSLLEVAQQCGFRSQAHFTTVFKRCVGETPHCWRVRITMTKRSLHA